ncbi:MAG TPA: flagellar export protein FliJ [Gemmatimonadaceae bacterium]|nr:flagellar export protein FliJ [Gemmatimonadaceae bacterium]
MFKFRLQRLLDLREQKEREKAVELRHAEAAFDAARAALAGLEAVRETGREQLLGARGGPTVGELHNLVFVLEQLDRRVAEAAASASAAEAETARVRGDLTTAHQERRALDRLRERYEAEWRGQEVQADRQTMDAIALARFTQSVPPDGRGAK